MSNLEYNTKPLGETLTNLRKNGYNHAAAQRVVLDYLMAATENEVEFIDPTNPYTNLMESACVVNAAGLLEMHNATRREYPNLAETMEDLYRHMSDKDYYDLESIPAEIKKVECLIQYESILSRLLPVEEKPFNQLIIPKGTSLLVNDYPFLLENSIAIRQYLNGLIEVVYLQNDIGSPNTNHEIVTNIIDASVRKDSQGFHWIHFYLPMRQLNISKSYHTVSRSEKFLTYVDFENKYHKCLIYQQLDDGSWSEIKTSYTDQVYDPSNVTAIISPLENRLKIHIPPVYTYTGMLTGSIRVDVYTTLGELSLSLSDRNMEDFNYELTPIDENDLIHNYSTPLKDVSMYLFSTDRINGGRNPIDFQGLKTRVIEHTTGPTTVPVSNVELNTYVQDKGYQLILNTDIVTNRTFLATRRLKTPTNKEIISPANISMESLRVTFEELITSGYVYDHKDRITIPPETLFYHDNGITRIYPKSEKEKLVNSSYLNIIEKVNQTQFMYTPFYYVLDSTSDLFDLRPYILNKPESGEINFEEQNVTLQMSVNTELFSIAHVKEGYLLTLVTKSGEPYKSLDDGEVGLHIGITPVSGSSHVYIPGTLKGKTEEGERVFEVLIKTTFDLDRSNQLRLNETNSFGVYRDDMFVNLTERVSIFYTTTRVPGTYIQSNIDNAMSEFVSPDNSIGITQESIKITFGAFLKHLWSRTHSVAYSQKAKLRTDSKPLFHQNNVYERDPVTGSIFGFKDACEGVNYNLLAIKGQPIRDVNGEIVFEYKAGDPILDLNGVPVIEVINDFIRVLDIFMVEGLWYFANHTSNIAYRNEFTGMVSDWVLNDMVDIDDILLEKTDIYFHPRHTLHEVQVYTQANETVYVPSTQSFKVECHVSERIFLEPDLKSEIKELTVKTIAEWIDQRTLSMSKLTSLLEERYGDSVISFRVSGLGGIDNYETLTLVDNHDQFSLKKKLTSRTDEIIIVEEDIEIKFINQTNKK